MIICGYREREREHDDYKTISIYNIVVVEPFVT